MKSQIDQEEDTCDNPCTCTVLFGKGHHMTRDLQPQRDIDRERERETEFASYSSYYFSHAQNLFTHRRFCTEAVTHRRIYTQTQTLLYADACTHTRFHAQTLLHTEAFIHRGFYTAFTHRSFYTQTLLHTDIFTHRSFYTNKRTEALQQLRASHQQCTLFWSATSSRQICSHRAKDLSPGMCNSPVVKR